ncbi:hypothetical protein [Haloferax elongans]|nr:hypothetical protein [Haloferax elongans]
MGLQIRNVLERFSIVGTLIASVFALMFYLIYPASCRGGLFAFLL